MEYPLIGEAYNNARGAREYFVSWAPNGSSDPSTTDARYFAPGFSAVAYVTGSIIKFTMIDSNFIRILGFEFGVQGAAGGTQQGFTLELDTTNTSLANGIVAVAMVNASGTRADVAADANATFFFKITLSKDFGDA